MMHHILLQINQETKICIQFFTQSKSSNFPDKISNNTFISFSLSNFIYLHLKKNHEFLFCLRFLSNPWNDSEICDPGGSFLMEFENIFLNQIIYVTPLLGVMEKCFFDIFQHSATHIIVVLKHLLMLPLAFCF